jgi:hypothetical protein
VDLLVHQLAGPGDHQRPHRPVDLGPLHDDLAGRDLDGPVERLLQEVRRVELRVRDAHGHEVGAAQHLVLVQRVADDDLRGLLDPDEVRQDLRAAPTGDEPDRDLGQSQADRAGRDGPVVAVERELEAAAEGRAVDERERGDRGVLEPLVERVPGLGERQALLAGLQARHELDVGSGQEDERLPGDGDELHVIGGLDLVQRVPQGLEPAGPEGAGLGVVVAVVERDDRGLAAEPAGLQVADVGLGDDLFREVGKVERRRVH